MQQLSKTTVIEPTESNTFGRMLTRYEPSLDGMRAVAVTAVVAFHATPWIVGGWAGVDVFFVLSGFLITALLSHELRSRKTIGFSRFYIRRALRLTPAFVMLLVASLVIAMMLPGKQDNFRAIAIAGTYVMNWNRAFSLFPQAWLGHTWSLAMEEQFYLVWPCILLIIYRRRPLIWIASLIVLVTSWRIYLLASGAGTERAYNGFDTHADALLIGCALALMPLSDDIRKMARRWVAVPAVFAVALLLLLPQESIFAQTAGLSLAAIGSAWLILAALQTGWLRTLLSFRLLAYTGRVSYGWYLWHYPILLLGTAHLPHWRGQGTMLVIAGYLVAVASYHTVERPFLRLKARFEPTPERASEQLASVGSSSSGL